MPALVLLLGFTQRLAHGTSLAAVLPIAIASLTSYALEDKVDWKVGALLAVGAVVGAVIGTHILHRLPHDMLAITFAVLLVATAVRLLFDHSDAGGRGDLHPLTIVSLVIVGLITGVLAGLLGVGGGIFVVPAMVVGYGIPAAVAKGTSLGDDRADVHCGHVAQPQEPQRRPAVAVVLGMAGVASAFIGGKISVGMSERTSNVLFAALLLFVAIRMAWLVVATRREPQFRPMWIAHTVLNLAGAERVGCGAEFEGVRRKWRSVHGASTSSCAIAGAVLIPAPPWPASHQKPGVAGSSPTRHTVGRERAQSGPCRRTDLSGRPVASRTRSSASATSSSSGCASHGSTGVSSAGEINSPPVSGSQ